MIKKLSIAIFHLAFVYNGGGERLVLEEAIGLSKLGHSVTLFAPIVDKKNCFPELMKQVNVKALIPKIPNWIPDVELLSILLACFWTPIQFWKYRKYDIYFGANQPGPWFTYCLSKINKKPYAIYLAQPTRLIHPRLIDQATQLKIVDGITLLPVLTFLFKPLINFLDRKSITSTPLVFANGPYIKGVLDSVYGIQSVVCSAASHIRSKIMKKQIRRRLTGIIKMGKHALPKPYLLVTNRHFPQKKFEYALEAHRILSGRVNLVIAGKDTSYTKYLKKRTSQGVFFVGLLSEKDLDRAYKNACVYLYPSPQEDFGMGIVEAMSYGVPVVAWENAGPTGIITHGKDGLLATPFVMKEFVRHIHELLTNHELSVHLARNAQQTVKNKFSYSLHVKMLSQYFIQLAKRNYIGR